MAKACLVAGETRWASFIHGRISGSQVVQPESEESKAGNWQRYGQFERTLPLPAASGLVHEEFHSERFAREGRTREMVLLWVNLPADAKRVPPKYQEILASQIPAVTLRDDAETVRAIAGEFEGTVGAASTFTKINVRALRLVSGHRVSLTVPDGETTFLVVQHGKEIVGAVQQVQLDWSEAEIVVEAQQDATVLLLSGEPIGEPVVGQGPSVMNTPEEIRQGIMDFQSGKFVRLKSPPLVRVHVWS